MKEVSRKIAVILIAVLMICGYGCSQMAQQAVMGSDVNAVDIETPALPAGDIDPLDDEGLNEYVLSLAPSQKLEENVATIKASYVTRRVL